MPSEPSPRPFPSDWSSAPTYGTDPQLASDAAVPAIAELSSDARLPSDAVTTQKRLDLAATTAAKMMRAAHQAQTALNRAHLFPCTDDSGKPVPADPIAYRDGVALQILKRLARQVELLESVPLEEGETELERGVKIAAILNQMTKQQAVMEQAISKAVGISTRASQEAAKLSFQMQAHKEKMAKLEDKMTAAEVEGIADG